MARGTPGALSLARAVTGTRHTGKAVPGAAAVREEGRQSILTLGLTQCSAGQKSCSPCFFASPSAFFFLCFFFFNCLSTSLAPSHATVLPAALEGNEAFAAKSDPCLFPSPPILGLAYVCSAKGARARFTWACSLLLSLCCCRYRLAACLAFEPARGWTALWWAAQHPSLPTHTEIVV